MFISNQIYDLDDVFKEIYPMQEYDRVKAIDMMQNDINRFVKPDSKRDYKLQDSDKYWIIVKDPMFRDYNNGLDRCYFVEVDKNFQDFIRKDIAFLDIGDVFRLPFNNKIVRVVDTENPNKGEINLTYQDREGVLSFKTFPADTEVSHYYKFSDKFLIETKNIFGI